MSSSNLNHKLAGEFFQGTYPWIIAAEPFFERYAEFNYAEAMKWIVENRRKVELLDVRCWKGEFMFHVSFEELQRLSMLAETPAEIAKVFKALADGTMSLAPCQRCGAYSVTARTFRGIHGCVGSVWECPSCIGIANSQVLNAQSVLLKDGPAKAIKAIQGLLFNSIWSVGDDVYECELRHVKPIRSGRLSRNNRGITVAEYTDSRVGVITDVTAAGAVCLFNDGTTLLLPEMMECEFDAEEFAAGNNASALLSSIALGHYFAKTLIEQLRKEEMSQAKTEGRPPVGLRVRNVDFNSAKDLFLGTVCDNRRKRKKKVRPSKSHEESPSVKVYTRYEAPFDDEEDKDLPF